MRFIKLISQPRVSAGVVLAVIVGIGCGPSLIELDQRMKQAEIAGEALAADGAPDREMLYFRTNMARAAQSKKEEDYGKAFDAATEARDRANEAIEKRAELAKDIEPKFAVVSKILSEVVHPRTEALRAYFKAKMYIESRDFSSASDFLSTAKRGLELDMKSQFDTKVLLGVSNQSARETMSIKIYKNATRRGQLRDLMGTIASDIQVKVLRSHWLTPDKRIVKIEFTDTNNEPQAGWVHGQFVH